MVDYLLIISAGTITASAVIIVSFLTRYRQLVEEVKSSTSMAKDVWDTANSRFSLMDTRIIDLMAKSEVMSSRLELSRSASAVTIPTSRTTSQAQSRQTSQPIPSSVGTEAPATRPPGPAPAKLLDKAGTKTEVQVLGLLAGGPKSSAEIKTQLNMSREHTARLMKGLFDRGLVIRNDRNKPYVYEITEAGRSQVAS